MTLSSFGLSALNRKLVRDLWAMKGQAAAVGLVVAAGVTMFVTYLSNFDSLQRTRAQYYADRRFADVFASLTRAPQSLERRIASLPGVDTVATRVVAEVTLDVPGLTEPASARLVGIPPQEGVALNDLFLRQGRWPDPEKPDEVLASELFCESNGFGPGDTVGAVINGRRRQLTIVGIALSPEYIYVVRPGQIFPDRKHYAIFWMGQQGLASAFDMQGGFNDVSLTLRPGASEGETIRAIDTLLEPYGGLGAIPRRLQFSAWSLENELSQLQTFGIIVPSIFLAVAAFILNVALTRALALQRSQIAALKALGYTNREIGWHYVKWALLIAAAGSLAGVALGSQLGAGLIALYNQYFRFPELNYQLSGVVAVESVVASLLVAALGAQSAVRRAVRIPPAEAMRPEAPRRYREAVLERPWPRGWLTHTTRMVLRNIERQPVRSGLSVLGIAFAVAVLLVGLSFIDIINELVNHQFGQSMRQDATLTFTRPRSSRVIHDVARLPGVLHVEPMRSVPVRLRSGQRSRTLAISGVPPAATLRRVVDRQGQTTPVPESGLVISALLGEILEVRPGDQVQVEVLEGRRPTLDLAVAGLLDDALGLQAFMHIDEVHRLLREDHVLSGAYVTLDSSARQAFNQRVTRTPAIAGVALTEVVLQNFRDTMAETMNLQVFVNVLFAGVIAFGVVYNSARVSLSERAWELASLRVLGFTRGEISLILLGELGLLTLVALPVGAVIGTALGRGIMLAFNNEIYRLSFVLSPATVAWSFLIVIIAAFLSGLLVRRRLDQLDLVGVLKTRE